MPTNRILVPVDGSPCSIRALEHAGKRQRAVEGVIILVLNVQSPLPPSRYVTRTMLKDYYASNSRSALNPARATVRRLKLDARFYVRRGDPARTIASFARAGKCSEIIMGTRGRARLSALVLGSVAVA
jgi:nucleotide-binding universal stress UspA family protein